MSNLFWVLFIWVVIDCVSVFLAMFRDDAEQLHEELGAMFHEANIFEVVAMTLILLLIFLPIGLLSTIIHLFNQSKDEE